MQNGRRLSRLFELLLWPLLLACSDSAVPTGGDAGVDVMADYRAADSRAMDVGTDDRAAADGAVAADNGFTDGGPSDGNSPSDGGAAADGGGGAIEIYLAGDLSALTFGDNLSGQTPTNYEIAVSRYYTLRSASDPNPALCFDHGAKHEIADMSKDNLVGSCKTAAMPTATYTHGRTKVEWSRYTVDAVYHALGQALPTKMTVFRAYSDTRYQGKRYAAGQGALIFDAAGQPITIPMQFPALPSGASFRFETINGEGFVTFAYTRPLTIVQQNAKRHWARFHWKIKDAYRWADKRLPGCTAGKWDIAANVVDSELVQMYGASGFYVTASTD
jgi:hypothetical protein